MWISGVTAVGLGCIWPVLYVLPYQRSWSEGEHWESGGGGWRVQQVHAVFKGLCILWTESPANTKAY